MSVHLPQQPESSRSPDVVVRHHGTSWLDDRKGRDGIACDENVEAARRRALERPSKTFVVLDQQDARPRRTCLHLTSDAQS